MAAMCVPALSARTLTAEEAQRNVSSFLNGGMQKAPSRMAGGNMKLAGTINDMSGTPALYLFTGKDGRGVVVASAGSEALPILGYSDSGEFDFDHMPPAMKWWLDCYAAEIEAAENGKTRSVLARAGEEKSAIAPIMTTQWNQNAPYNNMVPTINDQRCMTGCVATAMAQVMKSHNWPEEHGEGFVSYKWTSQNEQLGVNLSKSVLDWDNMLDTYSGEATEAQQQAVATLMRDCGYATEMQYSLSASGTTVTKIPSALYYNFGYDKGLRLLDRSYFSLTDWENVVYDELKANRPVIFTGVSNEQGGHCFVCDGYSSDRYYHINWGWGGLSDGYFLLSALNPATQGIGGSASGFNNGVSACVGISRPVEGSEFYYAMLCDGNFTAENGGNEVVFSANAFYNSTFLTESGKFGVKLTDSEGKSSYAESSLSFTFEPRMYVAAYTVSASALPQNGTYTVTPAFYCNEDKAWHDIATSIDVSGKLTMTAENGTLTFTPVVLDNNIKVSNVKLLTDIYSNANFRISADVVNDGNSEYLGDIVLALVSGEQVVAVSPSVHIDVEAGADLKLDYMTHFTTAVAEGEYNLCFITPDMEPVSEAMPVTVGKISGSTVARVENLHMLSGNDATPPVVPSNNVAVGGTLNCTSGYFANTLSAYVFPQRGGASLASLGNEELFVKAGETADFEYHGTFGNGQVGTTYAIGFFNGQTQLSGTINFVLGSDSGIEYVETPQDVTIGLAGDVLTVSGAEGNVRVDIYALDGAHMLAHEGNMVNVASLNSGAYIAVAHTAKGTVMFKFMR